MLLAPKFVIIAETMGYEGNDYSLLAQRFLESSGWTSITYDWLMVVLNTIDQS